MGSHSNGLGISQPVSIWNKPLDIEPKGFFLNLAKAAVNGFKMEFDDAFENLLDVVHASDLEDKAGQVAWVLIYRALMRSIAHLVEDSADLFDLAEHTLNDAEQEKISAVLCDHLLQCKIGIDVDFFERPERFSLLKDFQPGLREWLEGIGLTREQAAGLTNRLPYRFALALHDEWVKEPDRYAIIRNAVHSPFTPDALHSATSAKSEHGLDPGSYAIRLTKPSFAGQSVGCAGR